MQEIYQPLQEVFGMDSNEHPVLRLVGPRRVPARGHPRLLRRAGAGPVRLAHHSTGDVFEIVQADALKSQAALLAAWTWNVSEAPVALPHHAKQPQPTF